MANMGNPSKNCQKIGHFYYAIMPEPARLDKPVVAVGTLKLEADSRSYSVLSFVKLSCALIGKTP